MDVDPLRDGKARTAEIAGWAMYDWANSAYSTVSITLVVAYLQKFVVPDPKWGPIVWAWTIAASMLLAAVLSPILGAMADARANKHRWLAMTALGGSAAAVLAGLMPSSSAWLVVAMIFVTSLMFELSLGFYNAFLPEIASQETMGRVSAWGFTLGYLGGALALGAGVLATRFGPQWGIPETSDQLRAGIVLMGVWWGVFSLPALWTLRDRGIARADAATLAATAAQAVRDVRGTVRNVRKYRAAALFLVGYLLFNDGIQTVISQSSSFAMHDLKFDVNELIGLILMIQLMAMPGAMVVGWVSDRLLGQKATLMACLAVWVVILLTALMVHTKGQFWVLGAALALVLGGTQSVSRSVMGLLTPARHSAEFFGFFNFSGKATSFLGTFLFGLTHLLTGSTRLAIGSLLVFILAGWGITVWVDLADGRRQAEE